MSHKVITFHYTLTDADGVAIESSQGRDPVTFMSGVGMVVPGLEKEVITFAAGDKRRVEVKAEDGYGLIDFSKFVQVPREALPKPDVKVGDIFHASGVPTPFTVKEVAEAHVVLDGNHPLAGEDLIFDVELVNSRDATEKEIEEINKQMEQLAKGPQPPTEQPPAGSEDRPDGVQKV